MKVVVTCLFGLESLVGEDIAALGYKKEDISVADGIVSLTVPDYEIPVAVARLNMWVATGERVFVEIGDFFAESFDELFEGIESLPWEDYIPEGYAFHVNGYSRKSTLFGIPACQSISKKAIVKRLLPKRGNSEILEEDERNGLLKIQLGIVSDQVFVRIDTSGDGLHKRGYRPLSNTAPIRETLAAGLVRLSRYQAFGKEALVDPFCGSGTIVIEAARAALGIAPGIDRSFSAEGWPVIGKEVFDKEREAAEAKIKKPSVEQIFFYGSDIDEKAVEISIRNAKTARVSGYTRFEKRDALSLSPSILEEWTGHARSLVLCNPPYGERLLSEKEAAAIYRRIGKCFLTRDGKCQMGIRLSVISPDDTFEKVIGHKADKRRKLYNGNIKCQMYHYHKIR